MKDRLPTYPGRVTLTPVDGEPNVYDVAMADEPSIVGTPLSKETLLNDTAAIMAGVDYLDNPTISDAFIALRLVANNMCLVKLQVTVNGEPAAAGIRVTGLTDFNGDSVTLETDANGRVQGYSISTTATVTADCVDLSGSDTISTPIGQIVERTLALARAATGVRDYTTSQTVRFSPYITESYVDLCCVGGGGGGAGWLGNTDGAGGGGGYVTNSINVSVVANTNYVVTVGAGGAGGKNASPYTGGNGGASSFGTLASANGGYGGGVNQTTWTQGGAGNGKGGNTGQAGGAGTVRKFGDSSGTLFSGGGAGGGNSTGGNPYGGSGTGSIADKAGRGTGGGGGGGGYGTGYRGQVSVRWRART